MIDDLIYLYNATSRDYFVGLYCALSLYGLTCAGLGIWDALKFPHTRYTTRTRQVRRSYHHS
jgi:hypothetical protein